MNFWSWMRQAALILVGRNANGTNPRAASEYQAVAIDQTTRELMALAQLRLRDIVGAADVDGAADPQGRLMALLWGRDAASTARSLRTDTAGRLQPQVYPCVRLGSSTNITGGVTLYTVPAATTAVVAELILTNPTGGALAVTAVVAGVTIVPGVSIPAAGMLRLALSTALNAAETVTATSTGAIHAYLSGVEYT